MLNALTDALHWGARRKPERHDKALCRRRRRGPGTMHRASGSDAGVYQPQAMDWPTTNVDHTRSIAITPRSEKARLGTTEISFAAQPMRPLTTSAVEPQLLASHFPALDTGRPPTSNRRSRCAARHPCPSCRAEFRPAQPLSRRRSRRKRAQQRSAGDLYSDKPRPWSYSMASRCWAARQDGLSVGQHQLGHVLTTARLVPAQ